MTRQRRPRALCIVACLLCAAVAPAAWSQGGPPPSPVRAEPARREVVQEHRRVTGELRAVSRSRVATREAGLVVEHHIRQGARVLRGDVLVVLDSRNLALEIAQLNAEDAVAQATRDERIAELAIELNEYEAQQSLVEQDAANPKELADAKAEWRAADARKVRAERDLDVIEARRELLEQRVTDMTIAVPFDGVVVGKQTELGEWVTRGDPIAEIMAVDEYEAWLDVPQRFASKLVGADSSVRVEVEAIGATFDGVRAVPIPVVDEAGRSFSMVARLSNENRVLAPGMSVTAWVPVGEPGEQLIVAKDALLQDRREAYVYVARPQDAGPPLATRVVLEILFELPRHVVVRSEEIQPGDLVITEGNERLMPGAPVSVIQSPPPGDEGSE